MSSAQDGARKGWWFHGDHQRSRREHNSARCGHSLKEHFRDLPQSLLPREHYQAYIAASRVPLDERIDVVRLLVSLLGPPNIDTLYVLLKFLHEVSLHSHSPTHQVHHTGVEVRQCRYGARESNGHTELGNNFCPILYYDRITANSTRHSLRMNSKLAIVETMIAHVEEVFRIPKCNIIHTSCVTPIPIAWIDSSTISRELKGWWQFRDSLSAKVCSYRSGSWPFSLGGSSGQQRFFPSDSACPSTSSCPSDENESKEVASSTSQNNDPVSKDLATSAPDRARSPSRERDFRLAARLGAAAARRRFCNVVRAFRFSSVTRSSPNVADC
ncbi:RhoGAP domain protein [Ostertagia ostertagi]